MNNIKKKTKYSYSLNLISKYNKIIEKNANL